MAGDARQIGAQLAGPIPLEELAASVGELGESHDLPVTVREAIAARMDALPQDARAALLSAAVVGKTFWRGLRQAIVSIADVDDALGQLEARDLVRRDSSSDLSDDVQFTFKHMLIREVAYSILPRTVRRERHAAVAQHVEERFEAPVRRCRQSSATTGARQANLRARSHTFSPRPTLPAGAGLKAR
jgi:predicted ATPase